MGLTPEEKKLMERLSRKAEEPDPPAVGKSVNVVVDLANAAQVKLAQKFGFLPSDEVESEPEGGDDSESADEAPNRRGYFG